MGVFPIGLSGNLPSLRRYHCDRGSVTVVVRLGCGSGEQLAVQTGSLAAKTQQRIVVAADGAVVVERCQPRAKLAESRSDCGII